MHEVLISISVMKKLMHKSLKCFLTLRCSEIMPVLCVQECVCVCVDDLGIRHNLALLHS